MKRWTNVRFITTRGSVLFYRSALPLSRQTLTFVTGIIRRHRTAIGSRWRKLNPGQQGLLVLAYLRKGETFALLAPDSGSAPPQPGGTSRRSSHCSPPKLRDSARRSATRRGQATRSWS